MNRIERRCLKNIVAVAGTVGWCRCQECACLFARQCEDTPYCDCCAIVVTDRIQARGRAASDPRGEGGQP